ncbi:MAG TPA: hypothetical protein VMH02_01525 [Verrucomicrobiae bacterium]|nr:hypothetical protein [Verrucomicrobiae bacterium]
MIRSRTVAAALCAVALASCRSGSLPGPVPGAASPAGLRGAQTSLPAFTVLGPTWLPGKINAFAMDPANPKVLYIASGRGTGLESYSSAGISKTSDGGESWSAIDRGLTDPSGAISSVVNALWLDPSDPSVLLAATEYDGLFRSTDAGASWRSVYRSTRATQIVSYRGALYASSAAGILASSDDGASWRVELAATDSRQPTAFGVAAGGSSGGALYAGMSDGTIYAFENGSWSRAGKIAYEPRPRTSGASPEVHQIAVDPRSPATLYANTNDGPWNQDLHVSTDAGRTWKDVQTAAIDDEGYGPQTIAYSAVHPHALYVGTDSTLFLIDGDAALRARGRLAATVDLDLRDLYVFPNGSDDACYLASDQGLVYVNACSTHTKKYVGTYLSTTTTALARRFVVSPNRKTIASSFQDWTSMYATGGGAAWNFNAQYLYEDGFNELRPGNPRICYAYDEEYGLRVSSDGCINYAAANRAQRGIAPSRLMTAPIAFDPRDPLHMYLASGPSETPANAGILEAPKGAFESSDGGATLHRLDWPVRWPGAIAVDPGNGSHLLVGDLRNGRSSLLVTTDGGKTWRSCAGVPPTPYWYAISISPANGETILASNVDASNNVFVLRSTDGGKTFRRIASVVNAPQLRGRVDADRVERGGLEGARAPEYFNYSPEREIRYDQDVTHGRPAVVVTTLLGAYLSRDDGTTWQRLDRGLIAHSFWGSRWVDGYLYLASDGQGIVETATPLDAVTR